MHAIQIERFGGPEVLAEAEVPEPTPTREKRELRLSLGADAVVDSGRPDLAEALISANGGCGVSPATLSGHE